MICCLACATLKLIRGEQAPAVLLSLCLHHYSRELCPPIARSKDLVLRLKEYDRPKRGVGLLSNKATNELCPGESS